MTTQVKWNAERLVNNPLITPKTHPLAGHNIQGPSLPPRHNSCLQGLPT
jgi:hypothetical protein